MNVDLETNRVSTKSEEVENGALLQQKRMAECIHL